MLNGRTIAGCVECLVALALLLGVLAEARASSFELLMMPGRVAEAHQKWESECHRCHEPYRSEAQDGLCIDCHRAIGADLRLRRRYHGRLVGQTCRSCHTDHRGRDEAIAGLRADGFDHRATEFPLTGRHKTVSCNGSCHLRRTSDGRAPYRGVSPECGVCHRRDDVHRDRLGAKCEACHEGGDPRWKDASTFDHRNTRYPRLEGGHEKVSCKACHGSDKRYVTPTRCVFCHEKAGRANDHVRRYGTRCESCHTDARWREITFDHDKDTRYPLEDRHRKVKCDACHPADRRPVGGAGNTGAAGRGKGPDVVSLHRRDGQVGCASCHGQETCQSVRKVIGHPPNPAAEKSTAAFGCADCHLQQPPAATKASASTKSSCVSCHRKDDAEKGHRGGLGDRCEACHDARAWNPWLSR